MNRNLKSFLFGTVAGFATASLLWALTSAIGVTSWSAFIVALVVFVLLVLLLFVLFWFPTISLFLEYDSRSELMFDVIVRLGQNVDKSTLISTIMNARSGLQWSTTEPVEKEGHVLIGDLALRFDNDDKIADAFMTDGETVRRKYRIIRPAK